MIKLFVIGDVHIGKKYDRYPEIKDELIKSRFTCLERCIKKAESEHCDFFVVTGDLFDNTSSIKQKDVNEVVNILSTFGERVIVLPGNHDYYTGEEKVWKDFVNAMNKTDHNITLVTEFKELQFVVRDETVTFYPAYCQSKHSDENNLNWIKKATKDDSEYHIGLAHGALAGLSPDMKNEYFLMTESELNGIDMDVWLLGHTHIPYPNDLFEDNDTIGYKIYNPGTPEQTDLANNTSGLCFVISLDKNADKTKIMAHSYQSGEIRFFDIPVQTSENKLKTDISQKIQGLPEKSIVRLTINGSVSSDEYNQRQQIYEELLDKFMTYEIDDRNLSELITLEQIRAEFAEIGFAAEFLKALSDPKEIQMAYELIKKHQA